MKSLLAFWKKDIINKLISAVLFLLLAAMVAFLFMITNLPGDKSLGGVFSQFFISPTPTTDVNAVFTSMAQTAIVERTPAYLRGPATITPIGLGSLTATPTVTNIAPSTPSSTPEPSLTPTSSGLTFSGVNCVPPGTPAKGTVVDIPNGVSARILVDGLIYSVRYIGIDLPAIAGYAEAAAMVNGNLVWQHTVTLYSDPAGKDGAGGLYRYIVVDSKLVNLELIKLGLVNVVDLPSGYACLQAFQDAEQAARSARIGQWK